MNRKAVIWIIIAVLVVALSVCLPVFLSGKSGNAEDVSGGSSAEEMSAETISEWDKATNIWKAETGVSLELRVKDGVNYELTPGEDLLCTFRMEDGRVVTLHVQGLDYKNSFEAMVEFFNSKHPEKISVGKNSQLIIVEYDHDQTEIVAKINDMLCLTVIAQDAATAEAFFSDVMIRVDGNDFTPLDMNDEFEVTLLC